jgi:hypothetical protein
MTRYSIDDVIPTRDVNNQTLVFVWNDDAHDFVPMRVDDIICPECKCSYDDDKWVWDGYNLNFGFPFLVCECGEQFSQEYD